MKKLLFTIIANILLGTALFAQVPQKVNYQAVARDLAGTPLSNRIVNLTFEVLLGTANGAVAFTENQIKTTNQFGLFTAEIGAVNTAAFPSIAWGANTYFLRITVNGDVMPATQLLSVPYALHAGTASSGTPGIDGVDCWDLNGNGVGDVATEDINGDLTVDVLDCKGDSGVAGTSGANGTNGINGIDGVGIDSTEHNADGTLTIFYSDATTYLTGDLTGAAGANGITYFGGNGITVVGDTISAIDDSPNNELQILTIVGDSISISNGNTIGLPTSTGVDVDADGWPSTMDLDDSNALITFYDADNDSTNELQNLSWNTTNSNIINISGGSGIPLSSNAPDTNQVLTWNGANWIAQNPGSGADNWGTQTVVSDTTLIGDGSALNPLSGFDGQYSSLTGAPTNVSVFFNDAGYLNSFTEIDGSVSNETITATSLTGTDLTITEAGTTHTVDLSSLSSPAFTPGTAIDLSGNTITNTAPDQTVVLQGTGGTTVTGTYPSFTINSTDNVNDADSNATNELVTSFGINGANLELIDGGGTYNVALSSIALASKWAGGLGLLHPTVLTDKVGIGTNAPDNAYLHTVIDNVSGYSAFKFGHANQPTAEWYFDVNASGVFTLFNENFGSPVNVLNSNNLGNIGIGAISPTTKLHLDGSLRLENIGGTNTNGNVLTTDGTGLATWQPKTASKWGGSGVTILATTAENVGIGTTNPTQKLDVNGNITSDDYLYNTPKTHYLNVSNKAFNLAGGSTGLQMGELGNNYRYIQNGLAGTSANMYASVQLPDGAVVTNIQVYIRDIDATYDATAYLNKYDPTGPVATVVSTVTSSGSAGNQAYTSGAFTETIDNSNFAYHLQFQTKQNTSALAILSFRITYTVTKAD